MVHTLFKGPEHSKKTNIYLSIFFIYLFFIYFFYFYLFGIWHLAGNLSFLVFYNFKSRFLPLKITFFRGLVTPDFLFWQGSQHRAMHSDLFPYRLYCVVLSSVQSLPEFQAPLKWQLKPTFPLPVQ